MRGVFRRRSGNGGMTLLEVMVSLAILVIIAVPILSMFVASTRATIVSRQQTDAAFAAQMKLESMIPLGYKDILAMNTMGTRPVYDLSQIDPGSSEKLYCEITAVPYGQDVSGASGDPVFLAIFVYTQDGRNKMFVAGPDGKSWSVDYATGFSVSGSGSGYSVVAYSSAQSAKTLSGSCSGRLQVLANVAGNTLTGDWQINSNVKVLLMDSPEAKATYKVIPSSNLTAELASKDAFNQAMVKVTVAMYPQADSTGPIATYTDVITTKRVGQ